MAFAESLVSTTSSLNYNRGNTKSKLSPQTVYRRVLPYRNANAVFAIPQHNKILIHVDESLFSYSMDMIARASQNATTPKALDASMEKVSGQDKVNLAKVGFVKGRNIGRSFLYVSMEVYLYPFPLKSCMQ